MKPTRTRLRLNTEHLSELTTDELTALAGGMPTPVVRTLPVAQCLFPPTHQGTCYCPPPPND